MHLIKLFSSVFFLFHFIFSQTQLGSDIFGSAESDYFGSSVSLSSDGLRLVVGASGSDGPFGESPGYVRAFEYTGESWSQIGLDIEGELEGEAFGSSVSMNSDGTIIAVGATGSNGPFGESPGLVRVFEFDGSTWNQIGLDIIGEYEEDESGCAVALNSEGTRVAIGAIGNADNGSFSGHVRVYEFNGTSWTQIGQDIDGESQGDTSGHSVSLSTDGNIVAIGATQNDGNGGAAGHVRVYEYDGNIWSQLGEDIDGEAAFDFIGSSVSLANNGLTLAAGGNATWNPPQPGVVRVYEYDGSSWNKLGLDIVGEADRDYSGCSVSLTDVGTRVAIGAQRNDGGGLDAGHVRIYDYLDGNWTQFFEDMNGDSDGDLFGSSVSISSDGLVIVSGAPQNDFGGVDAGHVKIYSLMDTFQPQTKEELQTAVDLWVNDNASALDTYGDINIWDVSLITDMSGVFENKNTFNDDISNWDVSNVTNMAYMFHGASSFNQNLPSWDVSSVTAMNNVFSNADSFNGDISTWDVSNVTTMSHMFIAAVSFNQNISSWNVSNVTSMQAMFVSANAFAQNISTWDVSNVISMNHMFEGNSGFNQDISTWDVSNVSGMHKMFLGASSFNQNIGSWNTQNVTDMGYMFLNALNFNQNLSNWNVSNVLNMEDMFLNANALSLENQCQIHESWSDQNDAWPYNWFGTCQPELTAIPDTSIHEDHEYHLDLSDFSVFPTESNGGYSFSSFTDTAHVMMEVDDHHLLVHPALHWNGIALVSVVVHNDYSNLADTSQFTLNVEAVNDAPEFVSPLHALVDLNNTFYRDIHVNDVDSEEVTLELSGDAPAWLSLDGFTLTGEPENNGLYMLPMTLSDGELVTLDTFHLRVEVLVPVVTSVTDVPEDQGGEVYVSFDRSFFDTHQNPTQEYGVMRLDHFEGDSVAWVMVASGPAIGEEHYIFLAGTQYDSISETNNGMTEFKVVASMTGGVFHSDPVMGYSVDNIAPGVPTGVMAMAMDDSMQVTWDVSLDEDFQYFILEKSNSSEFYEVESFELVENAYTDMDFVYNESNFYRVVAVDHVGNTSDYSEVVEVAILTIDEDVLPEDFALHQNYPNPFNPTTQIRYDLPEDQFVSITIYDVMGRKIRSLMNTSQTAGYYTIRWDAKNDIGEGVAAGMYIYTIQAGDFRAMKKMVLLK